MTLRKLFEMCTNCNARKMFKVMINGNAELLSISDGLEKYGEYKSLFFRYPRQNHRSDLDENIERRIL